MIHDAVTYEEEGVDMPFIIFLVFFVLWAISIKLFPSKTSLVKQKFDYIKPRTTFYSKGR